MWKAAGVRHSMPATSELLNVVLAALLLPQSPEGESLVNKVRVGAV